MRTGFFLFLMVPVFLSAVICPSYLSGQDSAREHHKISLRRYPPLPHKIKQQKREPALPEDADKLWKNYLQLKKRNPNVITELSDGNPCLTAKKGIEILDRILKVDPKLHKARFELAMLYFNAGGCGLFVTEKNLPYLWKAAGELEKIFIHPENLPQKDYLKYSLWLLDIYRTLKFDMTHVYKNSSEISKLNKKIYQLIRNTVATVPPEELPHNYFTTDMADYFFEQNDIKGAADFFLFLDTKIGTSCYKPSHNLFYGDSPLGMAVVIFSLHKQYKEAKRFLDKCRKNLPKMYAVNKKMLESFMDTEKSTTEKTELFQDQCKSPLFEPFDKAVKFADNLMMPPVNFNYLQLPEEAIVKPPFSFSGHRLIFHRRYHDCDVYLMGEQLTSYYLTHLYIVNMNGTIRKHFKFKENIYECELAGDFIYIPTTEGLIKLDLSSEKKTLITTDDGLPSNNLSCIRSIGDKLIISTSIKETKKYAVFSYNPTDGSVKTYWLPESLQWKYFIDILPSTDSNLWMVSNDKVVSLDLNSQKWSKPQRIYSINYLLKHKETILMCANFKLSVIKEEKAILFLPRIHSYYRCNRSLSLPLETPLYGRIRSITSDGTNIWIAIEIAPPRYCRNFQSKKIYRLLAYNPDKDTWAGPFLVKTSKVSINTNENLVLDSMILDTSLLLKYAQTHNGVYTTEQYRKRIAEKFREAGPYAMGIYSLMRHTKRTKVDVFFDEALKKNPGDYRALFWKIRSDPKAYQLIIDNKTKYPYFLRKLSEQSKSKFRN